MERNNKCPVCKFEFIPEYFEKNNIEAQHAMDVFDCPGCGILLVSFELDTGDIQIWKDSEVM